MCRELPLLIFQVLGEGLGSPCPLLGRTKKLSVKSLIEIFSQCNGFLGSGMHSYHLCIDISKSGVESSCLASVKRNGCSQVDSFKISWAFDLGQVVLRGWPSLCVGCRVGCWVFRHIEKLEPRADNFFWPLMKNISSLFVLLLCHGRKSACSNTLWYFKDCAAKLFKPLFRNCGLKTINWAAL